MYFQLRSGNHLEANRFMVELLKSITPRLADSQSNLKPLAANALSAVASSVGPEAAVKVRLRESPGCRIPTSSLCTD